MADDNRLLQLAALLQQIHARPTVPDLYPDDPGLILADMGWRIHTLTSLWQDEDNTWGDLVLTAPDGSAPHAMWRVADTTDPTVEFTGDAHLPIAFQVRGPIRTWEALAAQLRPLIPAIARRFE